MRRSTLKKLLCPLVFFWVISYITVNIGMSRTGSREILANNELMETFVDRTAICDRLSRGLLKPEDLNASIEDACVRWSASQNEYFRLRETRVNRFEPGLFSIAGKGICSNDTSVIVLIHSHPKYSDRRDAIRRTWGGASISGRWPSTTLTMNQTNTTGLRLAFIFGRLFNDKQTEKRLREESELYGDVIQGDFGESYTNMTLKSLTGLHWASTYCSSARFLLKCDDDMFINIPAILRAISESNMSRAIMGPYNEGSRVYRKGKWAISKTEYPFAYYPPYESGSGYVINADLWRPLLNASEYVPYIFIDDVYVTGILGRIVGARHVRRTGFAFATNSAPDPCAIANGSVLTGTRVDPKLQFEIWSKLVGNSLKC